MITNNEAYLLGILISKGAIIPIDKDNVVLKFNIKFRRPAEQILRKDNIHTGKESKPYLNSLTSLLINDFANIKTLLYDSWGVDSTIDVPNMSNIVSWDKKIISITSNSISNKFERLCDLFNVSELNNDTLSHFPFHLKIEENRQASLAFLQGVCDACCLVPNEASSSFGGNGVCRIQIEPSQERWELPIGLCRVVQIGLGIPVNTINWGHPEVRNAWKNQNHQFRIKLEDIDPNIEIFRLSYKQQEYLALYKRKNVTYIKKERVLCPNNKRINQGETVYLAKSSDKRLASNLLDSRLRGISINVPQKKNVLICKLLGCDQCSNFFDIKIV